MDSSSRVERMLVSPEQFCQMTERQAFKNWRLRETDRRVRDWYAAHAEMGFSAKTEPIFPSDSRFPDVQERARQIQEEKKARRALRDWLDAEGYISKFYFIGDKP